MENIFKKIPVITILTAYIFLLGFFNLFFYYKEFDINISKYLNPGELIYSFFELSQTIYLLIFIALGIYLLLAMTQFPLMKREEENKNKISRIFDKHDKIISLYYYELLQKLKENKVKISKKIRRYFRIMTICGISYWFLLLTAFTFLIVINLISWNEKVNEKSIVLTVSTIFILLFNKRMSFFKKKFSIKNFYIVRLGFFLLFSILFLKTFNIIQADSVLNGKPNKNISFEIEGEFYESGKSLVYVGRVNSYLFLRDLKDSTNYIFKTSEIKNYKTIETNYEKSKK